ncbi:hexokinase-1-like protein isoform X1 [Tanacetum coccineum]
MKINRNINPNDQSCQRLQIRRVALWFLLIFSRLMFLRFRDRPCLIIVLRRNLHFLVLSGSSKKKLQEDIDEFSDTYYLDIDIKDLEQVINTKWGNFKSSHLALMEYDNVPDVDSLNPGEQTFEKMISGMYLGEILHRVLYRMANEAALFDYTVTPKLKVPFVLSLAASSRSMSATSFTLREATISSLFPTDATTTSAFARRRTSMIITASISSEGSTIEMYIQIGYRTVSSILLELSFRNLATLLPIRQHVRTTAYHCEEGSVMQHDMLRALAILLSSTEPIELRERLIINPDAIFLRKRISSFGGRYIFGITHVPRLEDWPVMLVEPIGFMLQYLKVAMMLQCPHMSFRPSTFQRPKVVTKSLKNAVQAKARVRAEVGVIAGARVYQGSFNRSFGAAFVAAVIGIVALIFSNVSSYGGEVAAGHEHKRSDVPVIRCSFVSD